jgi:serine/threonine protein kinase
MTKAEYRKKDNVDACNIHPSIKTINMITHNAGISMERVLKETKYSKERAILKSKFIYVIKHLLKGIKMLHQNGIVHLDIKCDNMGVTIKNNSAYVRHIDFGISENNKNVNIDNVDMSDIGSLKGTPSFIAPEMYVIHELANNISRVRDSTYLFDTNFSRSIIKKVYKSLRIDAESAYRDSYSMNREILNYPSTKERGFMDNIVGNQDIFQHNDIVKLYNQISTFYHNDELFNIFYKSETGILYKFDIYSLGISIFIISKFLEINDSKIKTLIRNMININPIHRFSAKECLEFLEN